VVWSILDLAEYFKIRVSARTSGDLSDPYRPILLKNSVFMPEPVGHAKTQLARATKEMKFSGRLIRLDAPQAVVLAASLGVAVNHFAIRRKFCAVAANRNSSCAPLGPRSRNRSSFKICFK